MENASQALIIAGAILLAILIIAIGMYIYNSASATITDSLTNMSTQEIEAFNNQFESYKGDQTGSQISSLMGRLIANSKTYFDEPLKVPSMQITRITSTGDPVNADYNDASNTDAQNAYLKSLAEVKNKIENKHTYTVSFGYSNEGLINLIYIGYDKEIVGDSST